MTLVTSSADLIELPIDSQMPRIMDQLRTNQTTIVAAETGAGKTTRIPQAILRLWSTSQVIMTQTRRAPVRWNGKRIAEELGSKPGGLVGWRLSGEESTVSKETRLTLLVDQTLVNQIVRTKKLPRGVLVIDEAHERSVSTDLLLGLIKMYLPTSPNTRVVVTSATIDTQKFSEYFDGAPISEVAGRCYPVHAEVVRLNDREHHTQGAARVARNLMELFAQNGSIPTAGGPATSGAVLVLLPGKEDITAVIKQITEKARHLDAESRFQVLSCHGESTTEEQDVIQTSVPEGTLRFVVGTEVLRSSVTVEGTIGVIDSLQVKRFVTNALGVGSLVKIAVSKAEADQGKGRAGRTRPGIYFAISFGNEYETLELYPQPAMLREPISSILLQVAATGLNVREFPFIDAPSIEQMDAALMRLHKIGALDENEQITNLGRVLSRLSLTPERAATLMTAARLDVLPEAVVVAGVLEADGIFHQPKERKGTVTVDLSTAGRLIGGNAVMPEWITAKDDVFVVDCGHESFPRGKDARWIADIIRAQWAGDSRSDFVAIVRAYRAFKIEEQLLNTAKIRPGYKERERHLYQWCLNHSLNFKRLRLAEQAMRQIRNDLKSAGLECKEKDRQFDGDALTKALLSGLFDNLAVSTGREYSGLQGSFGISRNSAAEGSSLTLVAGIRKTLSETMFADVAAHVEPAWLEEMLSHLWTFVTGLRPEIDEARGEVTSVSEHHCNGLIIWRERVFDRELTDKLYLRLNQLESDAITLYNQVCQIIDDDRDDQQLSNALYNRLLDFIEDSDRLPTSVDQLIAWVKTARGLIATVQSHLTPTLPKGTQAYWIRNRLGSGR
ncbi:MAG: DEAD/DEAH box helicase [Candidatus Saccharibacteria bacterium]